MERLTPAREARLRDRYACRSDGDALAVGLLLAEIEVLRAELTRIRHAITDYQADDYDEWGAIRPDLLARLEEG